MGKVKLLLGTKNPGKVAEAKSILAPEEDGLQVFTYEDIDFSDVEETGVSYAENSLKKAREISRQTGLAVLSDDSGLEVKELNGAPGVHSARFSGPGADDKSNTRLLLKELEGVDDREARFVTVATLVTGSGEKYSTEGILTGRITRTPKGSSGFGYDPLFVPEGFDKTLAQLGEGVKNRISHRRQALEKMRDVLARISP